MLGRRDDGYHEVSTILQTISLHDDLEFELTNDGIVHFACEHPDIPTDDGNLVIRAAKALKDRYRVRAGASIRLIKRIPTQGGLGGGSSNAATSLLALARLWNVAASKPDLFEIAAGLGADVPFFLMGGQALGTGTGATVSPFADNQERAAQHLIVITPNAAVSTADAYAALNLPSLTTPKRETILSNSPAQANYVNSQLWPEHDLSAVDLQNDFETVIFDIEPEIKRARDTLRESGALGALLAGSGSSVFGIFANRDAQQRALEDIRAEDGWRIFPCVTLSRNDYYRQIGPEFFSLFEQG